MKKALVLLVLLALPLVAFADFQVGGTALEAAGNIHTDLARGFIRAEVIAYSDLQEFGSLREVKNHGRFRLEGKEYVVQDGDLIIIRHSS